MDAGTSAVSAPYRDAVRGVSAVYEDSTKFLGQLFKLQEKYENIYQKDPTNVSGRVHNLFQTQRLLNEFVRNQEEFNDFVKNSFLDRHRLLEQEQRSIVKVLLEQKDEIAAVRSMQLDAIEKHLYETNVTFKIFSSAAHWGAKGVFVGISAGAGYGVFYVIRKAANSQILSEFLKKLADGTSDTILTNLSWLSYAVPITMAVMVSAYVFGKYTRLGDTTRKIKEVEEQIKDIKQSKESSLDAIEKLEALERKAAELHEEDSGIFSFLKNSAKEAFDFLVS